MNAKGTFTAPTDYWSMWLFFSLMFTGLSSAAMGFKYHEMFLVATGAFFIVTTVFAFRRTLPMKARASALVGMLVGGSIGAGMGLAIGNVAESLVGIVAGAVTGSLSGMVLAVIGLGFFGMPVFAGMKIMILPRAVGIILLTIGVLVGGVVGVITLRETIIKVFGPIGGGTVAVGTLGILVGLIIGQRDSVPQ